MEAKQDEEAGPSERLFFHYYEIYANVKTLSLVCSVRTRRGRRRSFSNDLHVFLGSIISVSRGMKVKVMCMPEESRYREQSIRTINHSGLASAEREAKCRASNFIEIPDVVLVQK
jgi:hypothetical protein